MDDIQQIQQWLQDLGPQTEQIQAIARTGAQDWQIVFEENRHVQLSYDAQLRKLGCMQVLGKPAAARRVEVLETLLSYNLLSKDTGGVVMAMSGPQGDVLQLIELEFHELNPELLKTVLLNFSALGFTWQAYVQTEAKTQEPDALLAHPSLMIGMRA